MNRRAVAVIAALFLFAAVVIVSCSKSTSPSYGGGGGGGGGGGTTINLTFPATNVSQQFTFPTAGTFAYHCAAHSVMTGSVIVSAGAAVDSDTVAVGVNGAGVMTLVFTPSTVTIKPGGHVRWINRSSMVNHTVTSP